MKRQLLLVTLILIIFIGAGFIVYLAKEGFKPSCYENMTSSETFAFESQFNQKFVTTEYAEIKDLGKSFLSILVAVFVASITFSEKIVNYNSTSVWAKSLLIACWILLLLSVVLAGVGLVFSAACFDQALHVPCPDNLNLYFVAFACFVLAGLFPPLPQCFPK